MPVTALNHYLIVSQNLERSKKFYEKVLGMELAERPDFGFPGYWMKTGGNICVHLASQDPNKIRDQYLPEEASEGNPRLRLGRPHRVPRAGSRGGARPHQEEQGRDARAQLPRRQAVQIFLKDPDNVTIELNFLGEVVDETKFQGKGSFTLERKADARKTR